MDVGSLVGQLTLNDDLSTGMEQAAQKVKEFAEGFEGMTGAVVAGAGIVVGAIATIAATTLGMTEHAAKAADAIEAFSIKTGIAVENVGPLQFAVQAAGGSLDGLNSMLMRMTMKEAADSTGKFSGALEDLGINAADFKQMDVEAKIKALGEGFRTGAINGTNMSDAMALMGRGGANLIPILEKMTPELFAIAQQSAILWTPATIESARQFNVDTSILSQSFENIATRIGSELLPVMSELVDEFAKSPDTLNAVVMTTDMLAHSLGYAVEFAGYLVTGFISLAAATVNISYMIMEGAVKFDQFFLTILNGLNKIPGFAGTLSPAIKAVTDDLTWSQGKVDSLGKTYTGLVNIGGAVYDGSQKVATALLNVGTSAKTAGEHIDNKAASDAAAAAAAEKHQKSVTDLMSTLIDESKSLLTVQDAFTQLYDSGQLYGDTLIRMMPQLDKLTNAHVALTGAQKQTYVEGVNLLQSMNAQDKATLEANDVTLEYVATQKARGASEQEIATLLGVSKQALSEYVSALKASEEASIATTEMSLAEITRAHHGNIDDWMMEENAKYAFEVQKLQESGNATQAQYIKLSVAHHNTVTDYMRDEEEKDIYSKAFAQKEYDGAKNNLDMILSDLSQHSAAEVQLAYSTLRDKTQALNQWSSNATDAIDKLTNKSGTATGALSALGSTGVQVFTSLAAAIQGVNNGLDASKVKVTGLDGQVQTLQQAIDKLHAGGSTTVTAQNFAKTLDSYVTGYDGSTATTLVTQKGLQGHGAPGGDAYQLAEKGYSFQEIVDYLTKGLPLSPIPIGPPIPGFDTSGGSATSSPHSSPHSSAGPATVSGSVPSGPAPPSGGGGAGVGGGWASADRTLGGFGGPMTLNVTVSGVWDPKSIQQMTDAMSQQLMKSSGRLF